MHFLDTPPSSWANKTLLAAAGPMVQVGLGCMIRALVITCVLTSLHLDWVPFQTKLAAAFFFILSCLHSSSNYSSQRVKIFFMIMAIRIIFRGGAAYVQKKNSTEKKRKSTTIWLSQTIFFMTFWMPLFPLGTLKIQQKKLDWLL